MKSSRHLSWDNFRSSIFVKNQERVHRVADSPVIEVFGDGIRGRIGLWLQVPSNAVVPIEVGRLTVINARIFNRKNLHVLELVAASPAIHRQFCKRPAEHVETNRNLSVVLASGEIRPDASGGGGG
jgi:hypothetical protein